MGYWPISIPIETYIRRCVTINETVTFGFIDQLFGQKENQTNKQTKASSALSKIVHNVIHRWNAIFQGRFFEATHSYTHQKLVVGSVMQTHPSTYLTFPWGFREMISALHDPFTGKCEIEQEQDFNINSIADWFILDLSGGVRRCGEEEGRREGGGLSTCSPMHATSLKRTLSLIKQDNQCLVPAFVLPWVKAQRACFSSVCGSTVSARSSMSISLYHLRDAGLPLAHCRSI